MNPAKGLLFVTGFPGSGLALTRDVLAAATASGGPHRIDAPHPDQVFAACETKILEGLSISWERLARDPADVGRLEAAALETGAARLEPGVIASSSLLLTWPAWRRAHPEARLLVVVRHPLEAAASFQQAQTGVAREAAVALWDACARRVLSWRDDPRVGFVSFESVLERPREECRRLDLALPADFLIDLARRRHFALGETLPEPTRALFDALVDATGPVAAALRMDPDFEARRLRQAASALRLRESAEAEAASRRSLLEENERTALSRALARARSAEDQLATIEGSLVFRLTRAVWTFRDRFIPQGSRRRSLLRSLTQPLRAALAPAETQGIPDDLEYALHRARHPVPAVSAAAHTAHVLVLGGAPDGVAATVRSLRAQTHTAWRVHLDAAVPAPVQALSAVDDRISPGTDGLAAARRESDGGLMVLVTGGAVLHPAALAHCVDALTTAGADVAYADSDHLESDGTRTRPWLKPDWSPDLVLSADLLAPLVALRAPVLSRFDTAIRDPFAWSWQLGLLLRAAACRVTHIPHLLASSTPATPRVSPDRVAPLIVAALQAEGRFGVRVSGGARLQVEWRCSPELVSIIIPSKDQSEILSACLATIFERTTYRPFEVLVVDTGSKEPATEALYTRYRGRPGFSVIRVDGPFNFSRTCNAGAQQARGRRLLFLNNDTEALDPSWLDRLSQWLEDPGVGAVGARLLYSDATLQHAGVIVGMGGLASHLFHQQRKGLSGPFGPEDWYRNLSSVTAACLLTSREAFTAVGGFDETLSLVYGDVDYCLKVRERGFRIVYTPDVELVHHESKSRGKQSPRADFERFTEKLLAMGALGGDPYFNRGLSYQSVIPRFRGDATDDPLVLNRRFMERLPKKPIITVPDDLQ